MRIGPTLSSFLPAPPRPVLKQPNRISFQGKQFADQVCFGQAKKNAASTPEVDSKSAPNTVSAKDIPATEDVKFYLKSFVKIPVPYPAKETWPISLMGLLLMHPDITKYLSEQCETNSSALSYALDNVCMPKLEARARQNRGIKVQEEKLSREEFLLLSNNLKTFAASENQTTITPVLTWRWLMKNDPSAQLEKLFKLSGFDKNAIEKLLSAPAIAESKKSNKPVGMTKDEILKLDVAMAELPKNILGQDEAIQEVINGITLAYDGYKLNKSKPNRPKVRFLFTGPSGVGKTFLAEKIAEVLERPIIYRTMTEFMDAQDAKKLTGSAHGYAGFEEPSFVDEVIEANDNTAKYGTPAPIIIIDEIEKAHPKVLKTLMQILDKGEMAKATGKKKAIFKDCMILMTSNLGQDEIVAAVKANKNRKEIESIVDGVLEKSLPNEVRGRINKKIMFNTLTEKTARQILANQITTLQNAAKERDQYDIEVQEEVKELCFKNGYSLKTGVRELESCVDKWLHAPVVNKLHDLIRNDISPANGKMTVSWKDDTPAVDFSPEQTMAA